MSYDKYSKATKETAENLRIIDDAMFRLVAGRKGVCQEILRTLLDKPELSRAVKYFKETEGGFGEMCKTVEDYAKDYAEEREEIAREEERKNAIRKMLESGLSREMILSMDYSAKELKAVEKELS